MNRAQEAMQNRRRGRFYHVMVDARFAGTAAVLFVAKSAQRDYRGGSAFRHRSDTGRRFQAAELWHADVHKHDGRLDLPKQFQGFPWTVCRVNVMSHKGKHESNGVRGISLVIYDQHLERKLGMGHVFGHSRSSAAFLNNERRSEQHSKKRA
jgi:hypothetical protein